MVFHHATIITILMSLPSLSFSYNSYQKDVLKGDALSPLPYKIEVSDTSTLYFPFLIFFSYILCLSLSLSLTVICLFLARQPPSGPGPPHSRGFQITHNDAPQSVGLLWTCDQLIVETSTSQHTTLTTDKHPCPRWDSNPQSQQASDRRPTPQTARPLGPALSVFKLVKYFSNTLSA